MSEDIVQLKGSRYGLKLILTKKVDFSQIEQNVKEKLETGAGFFCRGTVISSLPEELKTDEQEKLKKLFHRYGVVFRQPVIEKEKTAPVKEADLPDGDEAVPMLVVNRTLRSGQEVKTKSSVLVCGNVNPGAQIIAGGSIDVRGTCRGFVHAGAYGDTKAFVVADHLMPIQIRIASKIARCPDHMEKTERPERASLKDGQIVIEPIER